MTIPDRRSRLRSATEHAHRRLDGAVDQAGFFENRRSYTAYLQATLRARRPLETALDRCGAARLFDLWPERHIATALEADIEDVTGIAPVDEDAKVALTLSPAQAIGTMYVLEGSALGARQLAPRAHAIGMSTTFGARHFARQTAIPKTWSTFLRILEAQLLDPAQENACIEAAAAAFVRFEQAYRSERVEA